MTKKSASRVARDLAKKELENTAAWDDVAIINANCHKLLGTHTNLATLIQNPEIIEQIQDKSTFTKNVHLLANDLASLSAELGGLGDLHVGKTGRAKDPDEHLEAINIYEKYVLWLTRHDNVVMPTANHLAEQVQEAVDRVARIKNNLPLPECDPNVITDVEVVMVDKKDEQKSEESAAQAQ